MSSRLAPLLWPIAVFAVCCVLALSGWRALRDSEDHAERIRFEQALDQAAQALALRLRECDATVLAAVSRFDASSYVNEENWQSFAKRLHVGEPETCAAELAYMPLLRGDEIPFHESVHSRADAPYQVRPAGPREWATPITYVAPAALVASRAGIDPWSDPPRRAAMERARDSGQPTVTARVDLPRAGPSRIAVVQYAAVYRPGWPTETPADRRTAVIGYVGLPLFVQDALLLIAAKYPALWFELRQGDADHAATVAATPPVALTPAASTAATADPGGPTAARNLAFAGSEWELRAGARPGRLAAGTWPPSTTLLVIGLASSAAAAWSALLLVNGQARARRLAESYSRAAREGETRLRAVLDGARDAIFTLDLAGNILDVNRSAIDLLGDEHPVGRCVDEFFPPGRRDEYRARHLASVRSSREGKPTPVRDMELVHSDGRLLHVRSSTGRGFVEGREVIIWAVGDISAEQALRDQARDAQRLTALIFDAVPVAMFVVGNDMHITRSNPAAHELLGYTAEELSGLSPARLHDDEEIAARAVALGAELGCPVEPGPELFLSRRNGEGRLQATEWTMLRKDGRGVPVALLNVPINDTQGQRVGRLCVIDDISERKRATAQIEHLALHDRLTGLPNRLMLEQRADQAFARARQQQGSFALMLMDLDRFKQINDTLGHPVGDQVLQCVARRLAETARGGDTVARMGGDEFVFLLPGLGTAAEALAVAQRARAALAEDMLVESHRLRISPSIGIALYPEHGADLPALLKHADLAMYQAKALGRDNALVFDPLRHQPQSGRLRLEHDLRHALAGGQFLLHYQPLVEAHTGRVAALEALLRWQHPVLGPIAPAEFIALAEDNGDIVPIGAWVLRQACADLARLRAAGRPGLRMAVNISGRQLMDDRLGGTVREALIDAGLPAEALELEITESLLVESHERVRRVLDELSTLGVRIAIDDFGTGYSSLAYLARFPVSTIKVDRSFVRQIDGDSRDGTLCAAIVSLAHSLGVQAVAEGVETEAQRSFLADTSCALLQGYLFSRAVPWERLGETLARLDSLPCPGRAARLPAAAA